MEQHYFTLYFTDAPFLDASLDPLTNPSIKFQCRLTLEQAALCDTLQGLIPSRTFVCTIPACCTEADANYFTRLLAIYLSTNLSTKSMGSEINFRRPTAQRFIKSLPDALRAEFDVDNLENIRSLSHMIGLLHPPSIISKLQWAADELVNEQLPSSNAFVNDTHDYTRQVGLLRNRPTEISGAASNEVNNDQRIFTIISKSGGQVNLSLSVAKISPTLSANAQKGVMQFKLKDCDQLTIELVRDFLNLLSIEAICCVNKPGDCRYPFIICCAIQLQHLVGAIHKDQITTPSTTRSSQ